MSFNRNYAAGKLKHYMLKIFVCYEHPELVKKTMMKMKKEMMQHLCPIRHNRSTKYRRDKKRVNKHKMSYRYSY